VLFWKSHFAKVGALQVFAHSVLFIEPYSSRIHYGGYEVQLHLYVFRGGGGQQHVASQASVGTHPGSDEPGSHYSHFHSS